MSRALNQVAAWDRIMHTLAAAQVQPLQWLPRRAPLAGPLPARPCPSLPVLRVLPCRLALLPLRASKTRPCIKRLCAYKETFFFCARRRVQQMVQLAHDYLIEYLTNKRAELADQLFDEGVVHKDVVRAAPA